MDEYSSVKLAAKEIIVLKELEGLIGVKIPLVEVIRRNTFGYKKEGECG